MTLKQLRCLLALTDHGLSVSRAAVALHTSQPGVSKMVGALEKEIGLNFFVRTGNRLVGLTDAGRNAVELARRVLRDTGTISTLAGNVQTGFTGTLRVGTTHVHACYALVEIVQRFLTAHPGVDLVLTQGTPIEILNWVREGSIDIGVSTLPKRLPDDIVTFEAYSVERCLIVPRGHPLLKARSLSIQDIARYPLITYDEAFNSGWVVQREFQRRGVTPRVVIRATDANVIKSYVAAGVGIAILQKMAVDPVRDTNLRVIPSDHLFPASMSMISVQREHVLRQFGHDFINMITAQNQRAPVRGGPPSKSASNVRRRKRPRTVR